MPVASSPPLPYPKAPDGSKATFLTWRTPLLFVVIYCIVGTFLQENYPISHYPMYSNPSADRSYYIVADAATGKPLPIATVSGITCPKIGKIWRDKVAKLTKKEDISKNDLTEEQKQQIGQAIFDELRVHAKASHRTGLPEHLMLRRMDILYRDGVMSEVPTTLATETPAAPEKHLP
jgi:hypothetical protein